MPKDFEKIWEDLIEIARDIGSIETLSSSKNVANVNKIIAASSSEIKVVSEKTDKVRSLPKKDFQYAWKLLTEKGQLRLKDLEPELQHRKSIICAFIEKLPYVMGSRKPITLKCIDC